MTNCEEEVSQSQHLSENLLFWMSILLKPMHHIQWTCELNLHYLILCHLSAANGTSLHVTLCLSNPCHNQTLVWLHQSRSYLELHVVILLDLIITYDSHVKALTLTAVIPLEQCLRAWEQRRNFLLNSFDLVSGVGTRSHVVFTVTIWAQSCSAVLFYRPESIC